MKKLVYQISVVLTAVSLFWPALYSNLEILHRIPGNPALQAVVGVLIFGILAYMSYEDEPAESRPTAS